jgi:hypothetical protein
MRFYRFMSSGALLTLTLACLACSTLAAPVSTVGIEDFSGAETLIPFSQTSSYFESLTVSGVVFNDEAEGFLFFEASPSISDNFLGNVPGASKGVYGRTIGSGLLKMLIELPTPARRFGLLLSGPGTKTYQLTAINNGLNFGSIVISMPGQSQAVFAGIQSAVPFQQIRIEQILTSGFSASVFDDLRYEFVPEPTSLALLCLGTAAFAIFRRP